VVILMGCGGRAGVVCLCLPGRGEEKEGEGGEVVD